MGNTYPKTLSLFSWNSNLTGCPVFYLSTVNGTKGKWKWFCHWFHVWWAIAKNKGRVNETKINCPWIWLFRWMRVFFSPYNWKVRTKKSDPRYSMISSSVMTPKTFPGCFLLPAGQPLAGIPSCVQVATVAPGSPQEVALSRIRKKKIIKQLFRCCFLFFCMFFFFFLAGMYFYFIFKLYIIVLVNTTYF